MKTKISIEKKIISLNPLLKLIEKLRNSSNPKPRIVFTNGCFDLYHKGHAQYLQEAAELGDFLIVALNSDASVQRNKGQNRPIVSLKERAYLIASHQAVDFVIDFDEDTPIPILEQIQPDFLVKGGDYSVLEVVGKDVVQSYGGVVRVLSLEKGISSTYIIEKIRAS